MSAFKTVFRLRSLGALLLFFLFPQPFAKAIPSIFNVPPSLTTSIDLTASLSPATQSPFTLSGTYLSPQGEPFFFGAFTTLSDDIALLAQGQAQRVLDAWTGSPYTASFWLLPKLNTSFTRALPPKETFALYAVNLRTKNAAAIWARPSAEGVLIGAGDNKWQLATPGTWQMANMDGADLGLSDMGHGQLGWRVRAPDFRYRYPPPPAPKPDYNKQPASNSKELSTGDNLVEKRVVLINRLDIPLMITLRWETKLKDKWDWLGPMEYRVMPGEKSALSTMGGKLTARRLWINARALEGPRLPDFLEKPFRDNPAQVAPMEGYVGPMQTWTYVFERGDKP